MNNIFVIITFSFFLYSCVGKHNSDAQKATVSQENIKFSKGATGDTIQIDLAKSNIQWKGTKMRGMGKHEGTVVLTKGYLIAENNKLKGGTFTVDMATIAVTDIPESDTVPINNINNHLKSSDFFDVEKYLTSKFEITNIEQWASDSLKVSGNLTIKDITKNIAFNGLYKDNIFSTIFTFDRFQWNIAYQGITNKTMVDKDIEMKIELITK